MPATSPPSAGATLDDIAGDLRHAGCGRAGTWRVGKYVQMGEPAFLDEVERAAEHVLGLGRKSRNDIGAKHDAGAPAAQLLAKRDDVRARMAPLHALEDEIVAGL